MAGEVTGKVNLDVTNFRRGTDAANNAWGKLERDLSRGSTRLKNVLMPVAKAGAAIGAAMVGAGAVGTVALGGILKQGLAINSSMEQAGIAFKAFTKDAGLAAQIVQDLKKEADVTPFDTMEMVQAGQALISSAKGSREELMKLVKTAEILAALNPEQGLAGAAFSIREAEGGDYQSLIERFNISRNMVKQLKAEGKEGNDLIVAALKNMGAGPELVAGMAASFGGLSSTVGAFFDSVKADLSEPVFHVMKGALVEFAEAVSGETGEGVKEWAKAIGQDLGESAQDMVATIKSIDWAEMAERAKEFAEFMGKAAEHSANVVASLPQTGSDLMNAKDKVKSWGLGLSAKMAGFMGDNERKEELFGQKADVDAAIAGRDADKAASQGAFAAKTRREMFSPLRTNEVVRNWLKTRGKTEADLVKDKDLNQEVRNRFGTSALVGGYDSSFNMGRDAMTQRQVAYGLQQKLGRAPLPVEITVAMQQYNQTHNVMATLHQ